MIKIVIIGYGAIAKKHLQALEATGFKIVGVCNRSKMSNDRAINDGIKNVFTNYHEMINILKPEAILISVSSEQIYNVTCDIIPYSVPILVEKPSGNSLNEHLSLIGLSKQYQTPVMVALNRRFYSIFNKAFNIIGGKDKITNVLIEWSEDPNKLKIRGWNDEKISNLIFGNSIHGIDILNWLSGGITNFNLSFNKPGKFRWLMNVSGLSDTGVVFNFNSSWDNPVPWRVSFYSKNKKFVMAPLEELEFINEDYKKTIIHADKCDFDYKAGFFNQALAFKDLINNKENRSSLESVTGSMKICQVLYDNLNEKK